jgi:ribosome biogenesis protein Nip4
MKKIETIDEFASFFSNEKIGWVRKNNDFFLADESLIETAEKIPKDYLSIGVFMGNVKNKEFKPSIALVELLSKISDRKIFISKKSEWLFVCGRDLFGESIVKANAREGLVLVQNEADENLGYGLIVDNLAKKNKAVVKNLLDKGHFLRKERKGFD